LFSTEKSSTSERKNDTSFERFTIHRIAKYIKPEDKFSIFTMKGITRGNVAGESPCLEHIHGILHHGTSPEMLDAFGPVRYGGERNGRLVRSSTTRKLFLVHRSYLLTLPAIPNLANAKGKYEHTENYLGPQLKAYPS
jgi:hypothetical protein